MGQFVAGCAAGLAAQLLRLKGGSPVGCGRPVARRLASVCGALPTLGWLDKPAVDEKNAYLVGGGAKDLHCGLCGSNWPFRRGACPACGAEGNDVMELLRESGPAHGECAPDWYGRGRGHYPTVTCGSAIPCPTRTPWPWACCIWTWWRRAKNCIRSGLRSGTRFNPYWTHDGCYAARNRSLEEAPMKYAVVLMLALTCWWAGDAQARTIKEMSQIIKNPIKIEGGNSDRMSVMFPHTAHKGISCIHCHHENPGDDRYVSCTECHATPGARERDPMSMFMAFHSKNSDRSCYGCHSQKKAQDPARYAKFKGCQPCHMSPAAREAAAKAGK